MNIKSFDAWIAAEERRQKEGLELIASENFTSPAVRRALGSVLTHKYAEGYPGRRYYGGCGVVDAIELAAIEGACTLFGAEYANLQPHSGSSANAAVMFALLRPGDKILGFDLAHGGHLTHGSKVNFSGKIYASTFYGVEPESERIDFAKVAQQIVAEKPRLVICGASAYAHDWDYRILREAADRVGAFLLADIAHPAGLIATGLLNDPLPHCHVITTTTHKSLRGPRGGMILMGKDFPNPMGIRSPKGALKPMSALFNHAIFPGTQGGPQMHTIAAKGIAFLEALTPAYKKYTKQVIANSKALVRALAKRGYRIVGGSSDNHLLMIDLQEKNLTGKMAEKALEKGGISVNKNMIPFDKSSPFITSGIRLGTLALTTRGLKEEAMDGIAEWIDQILKDPENQALCRAVKEEIKG